MEIAPGLIQLTQSGTVLPETDGELRRLQEHFREQHWVRLPQLIESALLEKLSARMLDAEFKPRVDEGIGRELCLEDLKTVGSFGFLANNVAFFEVVKAITGCGRIGCFSGRVYRMAEGSDCYDSWHDDMRDGRMIAMSINLGSEPYSGGLLRLRERASKRVIAEIANTGFGDGILFRLAKDLDHTITDVEGSVPRTVFAGWFQPQPDFFSELLKPL